MPWLREWSFSLCSFLTNLWEELLRSSPVCLAFTTNSVIEKVKATLKLNLSDFELWCTLKLEVFQAQSVPEVKVDLHELLQNKCIHSFFTLHTLFLTYLYHGIVLNSLLKVIVGLRFSTEQLFYSFRLISVSSVQMKNSFGHPHLDRCVTIMCFFLSLGTQGRWISVKKKKKSVILLQIKSERRQSSVSNGLDFPWSNGKMYIQM